ncbi:MAG: hypothetical protein L0206_16180, partial [Actinobacteria bacterium]|nr:hypothetical protein [Actinomycetota bacterium]
HHTFQVNFALPSAPAIANAGLKPGIDGQAYPGDRIVGTGGVPLLAPYPPGFFDLAAPGTPYPSATAQRAYEWDSSYTQDDSYAPKGVVPGLPNALTLVKSAAVATNGNITGNTFDRGFLNVLFSGLDFYVGNVAAAPPSATAFQTPFEKTLTLSVSPDNAVYMRGVQPADGAGGEPTGLLDSSAQMAQALMTPILLAAGLFTVETGKLPVFHSSLPPQMDILPVLLVNGGSDTHNRKSIPSISGYWPAESNKEPFWNVTTANEAWKHCQQELTWVQAPNASQARVFMWAEGTMVSTFTNDTWSQRYQSMDLATPRKRGVVVVMPGGDFFVPAILDGSIADHGTLFGAEAVTGGDASLFGSSNGGSAGIGCTPLYTRANEESIADSEIDRRVHMHGTSTYIEPYSPGTSFQTGSGWHMTSLGRTATSVAMSADGIWCATALVGGGVPGTTDTQKILLWRTDKMPIPGDILGQPFVVPLTGKQVGPAGALVDFADSACIVKVGGELASGVTIAKPPAPLDPDGPGPLLPPAQTVHATRFLLPDSLMFVRDGLLFLNEPQLDHVFALSLVDGHLSSKSLNTASAVNGAGLGPAVTTTGQFIPDNDYMRAGVASNSVAAQFGFTGDKPAADEEGPANVAFVAGSNGHLSALTDLSGYPRAGYVMSASRNKSLFFMALGTTATGGLDLGLGTTVLRDLTGNTDTVYGDLLTPGRFCEELDFLALSDDGRFAAVVREIAVTDGNASFSFRPTFHTAIDSLGVTQASWGIASHDLMVISTDGSDMHSGGGSEHVLYVGTGRAAAGAAGQADPAGMPGYAVGKNFINALSRRVNGLTFTPDNKKVIFNYSGKSTGQPPTTYGNSSGSSTGWGPINVGQTGTFASGMQTSIRLTFRDASDAPVDFTASANLKNNLQGLLPAPGGGIGTLAAPFTDDTGAQNFWATFKSEDGRFLYFVSDQINASLTFATPNRNYMVGFNLTGAAINGRDPFVPFSPHSASIGFEQFDCNAWNYENRFKSVPGGVSVAGRDGAGILCVIASDASAGAGSPTDLEVYVMDTNIGSNLLALTSAVTTGTANAINHLSMSGDGNVLAGQIAKTAGNSNGSRAFLNSNSDLFVVNNLHAVLAGGAPSAFIVSQAMSHGASVAFVGEGTTGGPQAIIFSSAASGTSNATWSTRTLKSLPLAAGAVPTVLDNTQSHAIVLTGGRKLDDNPNTAD